MASTKIRNGQVAAGAYQDAGSTRISNLTDPASAQDAATKGYVDSVAQGLDAKQSVRAATTANITLSGTQSIDAVAVIALDRVLVKNQTAGQDNGIYVVAAGAWSRAADADSAAELVDAFVFVEEGTANGDTGWVQTANAPITVGTTPLPWTQFSSAGAVTAGTGLTQSGNTLNAVAGDTSLTVTADAIVVNLALWIMRETPTGAVNGANTAFVLANTPFTNSEEVYLNGLLQEKGGGADYTISGATITFVTAPLTGDLVRASYIRTP